MAITLPGSRYFGAAALDRLVKDGVETATVVATPAVDRLATAAKAAGIAVIQLDDPSIVPACAVTDVTNLIVAAHAHVRIIFAALARSRLSGIGYHPWILPRHGASRNPDPPPAYLRFV